MPVLINKFGADAHHALDNQEADLLQAKYIKEQWKDIYLNSHPMGAANSLGGIMYQWSDNWLANKQDDINQNHSSKSTIANKFYTEDYKDGQKNMNIEWFGITAKHQ